MLPRADNCNSLSRNNISSLQSSSNMNTDHPYILDILYNLLTIAKGKIYNINLCCIPGHIGIHGNNETDKTAKSALDFKISFLYETLWQIIRDFFLIKNLYILFQKKWTSLIIFIQTGNCNSIIGLLNWYWWILARVGCENPRACECILKPTSANIHQYQFNNSFII